MELTPTNAAWLAGFLDGEGCFQIVRYRKRYREKVYEGFAAIISTTGTDRGPLDRCHEIAGGKVVGPFGTNSRKGRARPAFRWELNGTRLGPVLKAVIPFLTVKREHAGLLLALRNETTPGARTGEWGRRKCAEQFERRSQMKLAMNALNHRGTTLPPPEQIAALEAVRSRSSEEGRHLESVA